MTRSIAVMAILFVSLMSRGVRAVPIRYELGISVPVDETDFYELSGAEITLVYTWDASGLTPTYDEPRGNGRWNTVWPATNTLATVKVAGTSAADGIYPANVVQTDTWSFFDDLRGIDSIYHPGLEVTLNDRVVRFSSPGVAISDLFTAGSTIYPAAYSSIEGTEVVRIKWPWWGSFATITHGFASFIPEPTGFAMASLALAAAALRRRK